MSQQSHLAVRLRSLPSRGDVAASPWFRGALVVVTAVAAYRYSLTSLLGSLSTDTPLAYLGLAPVIALGIALLLGRPDRPGPEAGDRYVDYLVGLPLLVTAVFMTVVMPARMSILYWYYRVDLLSLPLFVAGALALLFGTATLWRLRHAVAFLVLAWPVPYNWLLDHGMTRFSDLTLVALRGLVRVVPVAVPYPGGDGSLFLLHHGSGSFTLSVASACTGVDGFVGFGLVGLAVLAVTDGPRGGRALWLLSGMVLSYALNLLRLLLIFWAGRAYGQKVALDGLHPVLGLVLFCAGVAVMVALLERYRLRIRPAPARVADPAAPDRRRLRWRLPGRLAAAAVALALVTGLVGVADAGFGRYGPVADQMGAARLTSFAAAPIQPPGWVVQPVDHYDWAPQYYGSGAVWTRYQYSSPDSATSVLADVVDTPDLGSFTTYDVIACYDFHGYGLSDVARVALGSGVEATELTFQVPSLAGRWNALYWVWPVRSGSATDYERVVLLAPVGAHYVTTAATRPYDRAAAAATSRAFLLRFGRSVIATRTAVGPS